MSCYVGFPCDNECDLKVFQLDFKLYTYTISVLHPKLQLLSWFRVQQTFQLISLILQMTVQLALTVHLTWAESSTAFAIAN